MLLKSKLSPLTCGRNTSVVIGDGVAQCTSPESEKLSTSSSKWSRILSGLACPDDRPHSGRQG